MQLLFKIAWKSAILLKVGVAINDSSENKEFKIKCNPAWPVEHASKFSLLMLRILEQITSNLLLYEPCPK